MTFDYNHFPGRIKGIRLYLECIICLDPVCLSLGCLTFTQRMTVTWAALTHVCGPTPTGCRRGLLSEASWAGHEQSVLPEGLRRGG